MGADKPHDEEPAPRAARIPPGPPVAIDTRALFGAAREVLIRHGETLYRLRITSKGKLILTK